MTRSRIFIIGSEVNLALNFQHSLVIEFAKALLHRNGTAYTRFTVRYDFVWGKGYRTKRWLAQCRPNGRLRWASGVFWHSDQRVGARLRLYHAAFRLQPENRPRLEWTTREANATPPVRADLTCRGS